MTNYTQLISKIFRGSCSQHESVRYLLLLHELGVGAIVNHVATKNRGGEWRVDFLGANVTKLAIKDKVIALGAEIDRGLLAEKNKGENVAILRTLLLEMAPRDFPGDGGEWSCTPLHER